MTGSQRVGSKQPAYPPVDASPVKSFFVSMLTRDIKLEEAILDLLDNCIDGILRTRRRRTTARPYEGYHATIEFRKDSFLIDDNCGGIPWTLHDYAFRMGRVSNGPARIPGAVGVYGIGMKRAIFKMGRDCLISTQNGSNGYEVEITPEWTTDEQAWDLPVRASSKARDSDGTTIVVGKLYPPTAARFGEDSKAFKAELERMVATHYAFIIDKGFQVTINGDVVRPRPTRLVFSKKGPGRAVPRVAPFIFRHKTPDGVSVFLAVGFTRPIPTEAEMAKEAEETRYSSLEAGWTIVCNDRAVVYADRSELTGWGEAGVPRFHNQFIAISGIVEFNAADASKLPTTTTKRGIDGSSLLYLRIKNKMREGLRLFIDYTNKWKGKAEEAKKYIENEETLSFEGIKQQAARRVRFSETRSGVAGQQYRPRLPEPKRLAPDMRRISFVKRAELVRELGLFLFDDEEAEAAKIGEKCFDTVLKESRR